MTFKETRNTTGTRRIAKVAITTLIVTGVVVGPFFVTEAFGLNPFAILEEDSQVREQTQTEWTPVPVELPREWRWERKSITFDHMFREK